MVCHHTLFNSSASYAVPFEWKTSWNHGSSLPISSGHQSCKFLFNRPLHPQFQPYAIKSVKLKGVNTKLHKILIDHPMQQSVSAEPGIPRYMCIGPALKQSPGVTPCGVCLQHRQTVGQRGVQRSCHKFLRAHPQQYYVLDWLSIWITSFAKQLPLAQNQFLPCHSFCLLELGFCHQDWASLKLS